MTSRIVTLTPVLNGGLQTNYITVATAATYVISVNNFIIFCNTLASSINLTLPTPIADHANILYIIDSGGNSSANNITITPTYPATINGQASCTISTNYTSLTIISNSTNYFII